MSTQITTDPLNIQVRQHFTVTGVVQGVGFRPFVHRIASELGLAGFVGNDSGAVFLEVQGVPAPRERPRPNRFRRAGQAQLAGDPVHERTKANPLDNTGDGEVLPNLDVKGVSGYHRPRVRSPRALRGAAAHQLQAGHRGSAPAWSVFSTTKPMWMITQSPGAERLLRAACRC